MSYDLRPLSLAELLDRSFSMYRRHFWLFVGILAPSSLTMLVLAVLSQSVQGLAAAQQGQAEPQPAMVAAIAAMVILGLFGGMFVYWISYIVALGATTCAVSEIYKERVPTIAQSYGATRGRIGRLIWLLCLVAIRVFGLILVVGVLAAIVVPASVVSPVLGILTVVLMLVGMLGAFVLSIWMMLRYAVSVPAAVLEDNSAGDSIARSIELTRGRLWHVFVLFLFAALVTWATQGIFQYPFMIAAFLAGPETSTGFWLNLTGAVIGSITAGLTAPLAVVAMAVLYYDLRIRKEGLDVELLVQALRSPQPATGPSSPMLPG
jgi:hypothetical protein